MEAGHVGHSLGRAREEHLQHPVRRQRSVSGPTSAFKFSICTSRSSRLPVHLQCDCAVDDGEAEHSDPAEQNTPERTRLKVHDENLQAKERRCESPFYTLQYFL